jgi:hypothetical protein
MKKLLTLILIAGSLSSHAQKWFIGPELGMNLVPNTDDTLGLNFHPGWFGGLNAEYKINDFLSARTGIYLTQKQKTFQTYDSSEFALPLPIPGLVDLLESFNLNTYTETRNRVSQFYFELPLMISANYKQIGAYAGPYVGYNFRTVVRTEERSNSPWVSVLDIESLVGDIDPTGTLGPLINGFIPAEETYEFTSETSSSYSTLDFGFKFGLRYQAEHLGVNAFYNFGLLDYRGSSIGKRQTHQYFRFSVNYNFGLGKAKNVTGRS